MLHHGSIALSFLLVAAVGSGCGGSEADPDGDGGDNAVATLLGEWTADPDYQVASSWDSKEFNEDGTFTGFIAYPLTESGGFYEEGDDRLWIGNEKRDSATQSADIPIYLTTTQFSWDVFRPSSGGNDGVIGTWTLERNLVVDGNARSDNEEISFASDGTVRFQRGSISADGTYQSTGSNGFSIDVSQGNFGLQSTYFLLTDNVLAQVNNVFIRP